MDKERAIDLLDNLIGMIEDNQDNDYDTAFRMAIEALKAQLSCEGTTKGTTSDLISRQQALDIFDDYNISVENGELEAYSRDRKRLCEVPTIQPVATDTNVGDTISRQAAIDALDCISGVEEVLRSLPTIQPQSTAGQLNDSAQSANLIDRQQAIDGKIIIQRTNGVEIYYDEAVTVGYLKNLPSRQPEPHWILVSERMPEDYADVLVWFEYFRYGDYNCMYATHGIGNYSKEYNSWTINHETGWKDLHVFAWMPLPTPYKPNNK